MIEKIYVQHVSRDDNGKRKFTWIADDTEEGLKKVWAHVKENGYQAESPIYSMVKQAKLSEFAIYKKYKKPLTPVEREIVMQAGAVWHQGPNGEPSPAVWKSVLPPGKIMYITNTHRAYNVRPTLRGAITRYHKFIKGTA
jgi:hypothetical protein